MTAEHLTAYIQDESYLYTLNYEELKTLVMQYPYATNLRVLLLKKSQMDDLKDYDRNLQMVASYTTNRKFLYAMTKRLKARKVIPQSIVLGEEYLELTALSNLERLMTEKELVTTEKEAELPKLAADWTLEFDSFEEDKIINKDLIDDEDEVVESILELKTTPQIIDNQKVTEEEDIEDLISHLVLDVNAANGQTTETREEEVSADLEIVPTATSRNKVLDLTFEPLSVDKDAEWLSIFDEMTAPAPPSVQKAIEPIKPSEFLEERAILSNLFKEMDAAEAHLSLADTDLGVVSTVVEPILELPTASKADLEVESKIEPTIEPQIEPVEEPKTEFRPTDYLLNGTTPIVRRTVLQPIVAQSTITRQTIIAPKPEPPTLNPQPSIPNPTPSIPNPTPSKPSIELEIINEHRATIVETPTPQSPTPNTEGGVTASTENFTGWLRQFKMANPNSSLQITKKESIPSQNADNQTVSAPQTHKIVQRVIIEPSILDVPTFDTTPPSAVELPQTDASTIVETPIIPTTDTANSRFSGTLEFVFEQQDPLPENIFGLSEDEPIISRREAKNIIQNALDTEGGQNGLSEPKMEMKTAETDDENSDVEVVKKKKKKILHELAAKSLVLEDDVISETLASILAKQGNKNKAVEMYQRLALAFPEKSGYFAAKIEALNHFV